jgi:hypothetical protein
MVARETLLNYPDWNKPFFIHTDASDQQLGAVNSQNGKPIAFFSCRLSKAQQNYTTTEKELLSIVECLNCGKLISGATSGNLKEIIQMICHFRAIVGNTQVLMDFSLEPLQDDNRSSSATGKGLNSRELSLLCQDPSGS